ncbi:TRF-LIKE 3 [Salix koriyanagi]|uniref:TRF-LIKE 3 n=1 Tax=Salix koriyanagi TaxID=2511006 RepID=A0A9Q0T517_9ROSI|nr:TRF-LIKE 3 [Salix koriyanagi]
MDKFLSNLQVEGDGRLVPATEDELMEVESLLIDDRCGMHIDAEPGQTVGCISNEGSSSWMAQLESLEGLSQPKSKKVDPDKLNGRLEYIEDMLQKVKEEERLHIACGSPDCSSACVIVDSQCSDPHDKLLHIDEKLQCEIPLQEPVPSLAPSLRESNLNQSGSVGELVAGGSPLSVTTKPDFSILKGEICLDNLSIKELHETFKATFGRETTVKDKQWLKRRISMGLTNSCAVSTNFIIKDNKFAKKGNEEGCNGMYGSFAKDPSIVNQKGLPTCLVGQLDYHKVVPERRLENHNIDDYSGSDDHENEQRAAKRVRKPTKRYIEEFSEVESKESSGRLLNLAKNSGHGLMSPKSHVRLVRNVSSGGRTVVTRLDSLGGSGIQVPCVSRVRRSRPRKNFMALLKFNPSGMGMAATLVKKALDDHSFPPDDGNEDRVLKASSTPEHVHHLFVGMPEKGKQFSVMSAAGLGNNMEMKMNSSGDSDDNVVTVPTSKGGVRRKHHRAWTLSEVMKLVEGVSRYGAGRWSEIKRLVFASYSYRTSVDLKDKWRNLLKASFTQTPPDTGVSSFSYFLLTCSSHPPENHDY